MHSIEVKELTKKFGNLIAIDNLSLNIEEGQIYAILGPNGAGKTTFIKLLSTILNPSSGKIIIHGYDTKKDLNKIRKSIGLVSHNHLLYEELSVLENIKFYSEIFEVDVDSEKIINKLNLSRVEDKIVRNLSRGMKQRAAIARALLHNPTILLLDEPTTGLDIESKELFYELIQELRDENATIVLSTHSIEEATKLCKKGVVLNHGKKFAEVDLTKDIGKVLENIKGL